MLPKPKEGAKIPSLTSDHLSRSYTYEGNEHLTLRSPTTPDLRPAHSNTPTRTPLISKLDPFQLVKTGVEHRDSPGVLAHVEQPF